MDMDSKRILDGSNVHTRYLTASIAKTLTAYVVIMEEDLDSEVVMDYEDTIEEGSSLYLKENEKVTVRDLLYGLMLRSGNDAASALAKKVGGSKEGFAFIMNEYAKIIGMKNSTFENPSGLDSESKNYSTPYDMALLTSVAYQNETFREIFGCKKYTFNDQVFFHKHRLVKEGSPFSGGKTGYTKLAGRTLITTASKDGKNLVVVTFKDNDDWKTHRYLVNKGLSDYNKELVVSKQIFKNKEKGNYLPYLDKDIYFLKKKKEKVSLEICIYENILFWEGNLEIYIDKELVLTYPLKGYDILEMGVLND